MKWELRITKLTCRKDGVRSRWEARYFVYPGTVALPDVVVALVRADSGDRLLDYFKPGS